MSDLYLDFEIKIVLLVQSLGNWLLSPMQFFTFMGTEWFFLLIAPAIYWCINASTGLRMGIYLSISAGVNAILKIIFHTPRPYWYDRRVAALSTETTFGLPSGHAQNAVVVWGSLAASIGKRWAWIAAVILSIMVGFSRIYLGVHFPVDILAGWLIGALLLWILLKLEPQVLRWLEKQSLVKQVSAVFLASILMIVLAVLLRLALINWSIPPEWIENAHAANPEADPIDPLALSGLVSNAAVLFGFAAGGILINNQGGFTTRGSWWQLLLRYLLGLLGVFLLWFGLGEILPDGEDFFGFILRYIRYALIGFWVSVIAPMIFIWLRLSERQIK